MTSSPPPPPPVSLEAAAEVARALGNAAFSRGAWSVAVDHYEAAALGNPKDARPRANAAAALLKIGRTREARAQAARAVELQPSWPKAHWRCAEVCEASGDAAGAARAFERAVELMEEATQGREKENATTAKMAKTTSRKEETSPCSFPKERRVAAAARLRAERERRVEEAASALDSRPRAREQMLVRERKEKKEAFFSIFRGFGGAGEEDVSSLNLLLLFPFFFPSLSFSLKTSPTAPFPSSACATSSSSRCSLPNGSSRTTAGGPASPPRRRGALVVERLGRPRPPPPARSPSLSALLRCLGLLSATASSP